MSREEHQRHHDCIVEAIGELGEKLRILQYERDIEGAWLSGWDACECTTAAMTAAALSTAGDDNPLSSDPLPRQRRDIEGPVMGLLNTRLGDGSVVSWSERDLAISADLPFDSVHAFLLRAVKAGKVVKDGDLYRLPTGTPEPAEAQAEAGLTADSGTGSANVSEGVTAERDPASDAGGETQGHMEMPRVVDPPAGLTPADIERDILGMLAEDNGRSINTLCEVLSLPYGAVSTALASLSKRGEILLKRDGWALAPQSQNEAAA